MREIRDRVLELVDDGVAEDFLVRSIRRELDEFAEGRADIETYNKRVRDFRSFMQQMLEDPELRANFRVSIEQKSADTVGMTDEEYVAHLQQSIEESPLKEATPEEVATRWTDSQLWSSASKELLSDKDIERWRNLWTARST